MLKRILSTTLLSLIINNYAIGQSNSFIDTTSFQFVPRPNKIQPKHFKNVTSSKINLHPLKVKTLFSNELYTCNHTYKSIFENKNSLEIF
ncbi:MAG TPA: hypothetical protein PKD00_09750 [Burkholderiales bacterium]|nr:hypothetical protein [Burkholderiales bacterium]